MIRVVALGALAIVSLRGVHFAANNGLPWSGDETRADEVDGAAVYRAQCLSCHQADGGGVPGLNAPLIDSLMLAGDKGSLIRFLLTGERETPSDEFYANVMARFAHLSDEEMAAALTYTRAAFVDAGPVTATEVAAERTE